MYLAIDGDNVGCHLEYLIITNNCKAIIQFSFNFQQAMIWLEDKLVNDLGAKIIFMGGDNLLAYLNNIPAEAIEPIKTEFIKRANKTLSIGLGDNPRQAYLALKLAKTSGKNRICHFRDIADA